jgi:ABC-type sugar transport system substrate-binding protein
MAQDFKGIGTTTADLVKRYLGGEKLKQSVVYVPTKLVTQSNANQ